MCGEFVACIYELLGLLPQRRAAAVAMPPVGASARGGDGPPLSSSGFSTPAATRSRSGSEAGATLGGSGRRSSVTSTDSSRGGRPPRPPVVAHDPSCFSATVAAGGSPGGVAASSSGAAAGGPLSRGTVVVVDAVEPDFRHFTPSSFSTLHRPRLQLLRGRLEPEEVLDVSHDGGGDAGLSSSPDARAAPGARAAAAIAAETAAAVHALTAGTALGDPAARPSTTATRAASRAASDDAPPPPAAAYVSARAPRLDEREPSRLLPPLRVSDGGARGVGAGVPPPLPTTSVEQRGGDAHHSPGWGGAVLSDVGGHTVAIDVARASDAGASEGSWRQAARRM